MFALQLLPLQLEAVAQILLCLESMVDYFTHIALFVREPPNIQTNDLNVSPIGP